MTQTPGMSAGVLARSIAFAALFFAAVAAGRLTVMDGTSLSLVWPAVGVAVVWFAAQRGAGTWWIDTAALALTTLAVNAWTGASPGLAAGFALANLVQVWAFLAMIGWLAPHLWGAGGDQRLGRLSDLWRLLVAAAVSTACGATVGPTAVWWFTGNSAWEPAVVWLARNTVSVVLITAVGMLVGPAIAARRDQGLSGWVSEIRSAVTTSLRNGKAVELVAVTVGSVAAYTVTFGLLDGLPIAFPLLVITVWVAVRFTTTVVVLHDLVVGTIAVLVTLSGNGPFARIPSDSTRALVVQAFVGVVAVVGLALALGRDERDALLEEVCRAQKESDQRAHLFRTVMESMAEGLAVVDADHRYLVRNPAAVELLGGVDRQSSAVESSQTYGLFRPDGIPLPESELPYVRALAGEVVRELDVVVRNPGVPAGRTLCANATPLVSDVDDGTAAVVVFRDVTAERRHRDELVAFAGVVAHDLLNPLATVEGWAELLQDTIRRMAVNNTSEEALPERAQEGLARIQRAAVRMRHLISDLLDYTTAGEGLLDPQVVDVRQVLDDVLRARLESLDAAGLMLPEVSVGDLQPVLADPALLRQLLDNLVGNSLRYTAEGVPAQLEIDSSVQGVHVMVTVADRGLGIPPGQHEAVFDTFHRAHAASDRPGTGLGLAICRRIVDRHGGRIWAEDNPGGGARLCFTLPVAPHVPAQRAGADAPASVGAR